MCVRKAYEGVENRVVLEIAVSTNPPEELTIRVRQVSSTMMIIIAVVVG